jgi:hypothetical protein
MAASIRLGRGKPLGRRGDSQSILVASRKNTKLKRKPADHDDGKSPQITRPMQEAVEELVAKASPAALLRE